MKALLIFAVLGGLSLSACAYPTSTIEQGVAPGRLKVADAPLGTVILVDGRTVGVRSKAVFDLFPVERGTHTVEEQLNGRVLLHKAYSIDAGATVTVAGKQ